MVTILWSMMASASLTLAAIYLVVWFKKRSALAHLLFSITAIAVAALAFCELRVLHATTNAELSAALRWVQVPLLFLLVSVTWFVRVYLDAGRTWLACTTSVMRVIYVLPNLLMGHNPLFLEMARVRRVPLFGESVAVAEGVANPFVLFGHLAGWLIVVFVADAGITAWRRGARRKALVVAGSVECFIVGSLLTSGLVVWLNIGVPMVISIWYMALIAVMGYELTRDVIRASQLVDQLQSSETRLRSLSGRLLSAHEEERRRIARELHDSLSQQMAVVAIEIEQLAVQPGQSPGLAQSMRQLGAQFAAIANELHNLSHRLHSAKLEALGLVSALRGHCQEVLAQGLQVHFSHVSVPRRLPADLELCMFRIVQEGLTNVVKHSGARKATVTVTGTEDALAVRIVDLGRGFDLPAATESGSLGLASMRERLRLIGGELRIESMAGRGTTIEAVAPLRPMRAERLARRARKLEPNSAEATL